MFNQPQEILHRSCLHQSTNNIFIILRSVDDHASPRKSLCSRLLTPYTLRNKHHFGQRTHSAARKNSLAVLRVIKTHVSNGSSGLHQCATLSRLAGAAQNIAALYQHASFSQRGPHFLLFGQLRNLLARTGDRLIERGCRERGAEGLNIKSGCGHPEFSPASMLKLTVVFACVFLVFPSIFALKKRGGE
eukprot:m.232879 g.232879  ORF g.232879 m.232879 type:complete len:189 (+) comp18898_c0_seq1:1252-1818(+)